jgi:hypothetical protein
MTGGGPGLMEAANRAGQGGRRPVSRLQHRLAQGAAPQSLSRSLDNLPPTRATASGPSQPSRAAKRRRVGRRAFTDGVDRDVWEDSDGQQYVIDDAKKRVHGQWLPPADEAVVVVRSPLNFLLPGSPSRG